jgi:hypothetical protein
VVHGLDGYTDTLRGPALEVVEIEVVRMRHFERRASPDPLPLFDTFDD